MFSSSILVMPFGFFIGKTSHILSLPETERNGLPNKIFLFFWKPYTSTGHLVKNLSNLSWVIWSGMPPLWITFLILLFEMSISRFAPLLSTVNSFFIWKGEEALMSTHLGVSISNFPNRIIFMSWSKMFFLD